MRLSVSDITQTKSTHRSTSLL